MRRVNYLSPRTWRTRTALTVALTAIIAAVGLFVLGDRSEAAQRSRYWLECPTTSVTEGDSVDVFLKRAPISSDVNRNYYAYWHTDEGTASASNDYTPLNGMRQSTSDHPGARASNSLKRVIETKSDPRVEHDETFTVRFTPIWNVRDMNDPDYDDRCEITIENDDEFTVEAGTSTDGTKVNVTLNEGVKNHLLMNWLVNTFDFPLGLFYRAVFDVRVDGKWTVPEEADVSGRKITLTMDEPITEGQSVKVHYDNVFAVDSVGMFKNGAGITFPNFGNASVVNNSTVADAAGGSSPSISVNLEDLLLTEGTHTTLKVKLDDQPTDTVTVDLSNYPSGTTSDDDSLFLEPDELTFDSGNWSTWQEVRVAAVEDSDAVSFWALLTLSASGGNYDDYERHVRVLAYDNDLFHIEGSDVAETSPGNFLLTVDEGGSVTYGVKLKRRPAERIDVSLESDWSGLTVSPSSLLFNKNNWSTLQTVTVTAAVDSTPSNRYYKVTHDPSGGGYEENRNQSLSLLVDVQDNVPAVTVNFDQSSYTVAEGGTVSVKVKLSADPERRVIIPITMDGQDGASSDDYSGGHTSVIFNPGVTEQEFTFSATADDVDDDDESVKLGFGTLPDAVTEGSPNEAVVSITDDDDPAVTVRFEQATYTAAEGASATVKLLLSAEPEREIEITLLKTNEGGATTEDYSGVPATVTFSSTDTEKEFTFNATQDTIDDDGESVKLSFGSPLPDGVSSGTPNDATVNITDDDLPSVTVNFEQGTYTVAEGSTVTVTVTLSADPERTVIVPLTKDDQDGATDSDYSGVPSFLTFNSGDTEKSFDFSATADDVNDDDESVKLGFDTLLPAGVTEGSTNETTVSITDDDVPSVTVSFEQGTYTVAEGGTVSVTVALSADPERTVEIPLTKDNQDGATNDDYSGVPTSLTFNSGDTEKSFDFSATADDVEDDGESVKLGFDTLPTGVTEGSTNETVVSITVNNEEGSSP